MKTKAPELSKIQDKKLVDKFERFYDRGWTVHRQRTIGLETLIDISRNKALRSWEGGGPLFSEGTTQAIKRKLRATTLQRVPDGKLTTQYDKNSLQQVQCEFIFNQKILASEYDNKDTLKLLWRVFNMGYDLGFAPVKSGFEKDLDSDVRVSHKLLRYNDIIPCPDCDYIEEADWYMVREYVAKSELECLVDEENEVRDSSYNADVVRYILEMDTKDGVFWYSRPMKDQERGVMRVESMEVRTLYKRGEKDFITYVPSLSAVLRTVKNHDPRRDVPIHFFIPEPDPEYPLGCPVAGWTLGYQQVADAFLSSVVETLELALHPPLVFRGANRTKEDFAFVPYAWWDLGTSPNNNIEAQRIETATMNAFPNIVQHLSSGMLKNMNAADATVASDANVMTYSGTPQGVEAQRQDKTTAINQFQKRMEMFVGDMWNYDMRSYLNSMSGEQWLTVDEETRRRVWDIEKARAEAEGPEGNIPESIIDGDKIKIDFSDLSTDRLLFEVRTGSLIQDQKQKEIDAIQRLALTFAQVMSNVSEDNKQVFEASLMQMFQRLAELTDIDLSAQIGQKFGSQIEKEALMAVMEEVMSMQQQMQGQQQQIDQMSQGQEGMPQMQPNPMQGQPMPQQQSQPPLRGPQQPSVEVSAESPEPGAAVPI